MGSEMCIRDSTVPADDEGGGFPFAGFDLHGAGDGLPHLGLTGGDVYKEQRTLVLNPHLLSFNRY